MLSNIYKESMKVGNLFRINYEEIEMLDDWSASVECASLAQAAHIRSTMDDIKIEEVAESLMKDIIINNGHITSVEHGWDDYCRGFIAGNILGEPTQGNLTLAEQADKIWNNDTIGAYGYYQEIIEMAEKVREAIDKHLEGLKQYKQNMKIGNEI